MKKIAVIGQIKSSLQQIRNMIIQVVQAEATDIAALKNSKQDKLSATCDTAASTAAKVATLGGFTLETGAVVAVKFTNANSASSPTLNVDDTGAIPIKRYGTTAVNTYMWAAGAVVEFLYDGTNWIMIGGTLATTTYYGVTKLSSSVSSTSTALAATPSAVKQAYDLANSKQTKPLKGSITIPTTGWSSDSTADYPLYYDFDIADVTEDDHVIVDLPPASLSAAAACGLCPACETLAGKIRLRAVNVPAASMTASYWIWKGV